MDEQLLDGVGHAVGRCAGRQVDGDLVGVDVDLSTPGQAEEEPGQLVGRTVEALDGDSV